MEISSRPAKLLLAYLVLFPGKRHTREQVAGLLWPDSDEANARSNLRQALWRLRKAIGNDCLRVDNETVSFFREAGCWSDVAILNDGSAAKLQAAVAAYNGELLPGYYEEWVLLERQKLQATFERTMERFLDGLQQAQQWAELEQWAEHWIAFGTIPEPAYRALMIAHAARGDLAGVAAAYARCVDALRLEVGVEPSAETRALHKQLLQQSDLTAASSPTESAESTNRTKPRHNLPHQSTVFVGRERELAQISDLLLRTRLLTLVGPGGMGKTRLAQEAASAMVGSFNNGVYFVSLALVDSPELIVQTIAETIGFPLSSHEDPRRQLLRHLRQRQYLLVLDNFEHLLPGASLVSEVLHVTSKVKIMATSRERLALKEETVLRLEGLAHPPVDATLDVLERGAAKLFVESARKLQPDFIPEASEVPHILDICRLLEGMPLAILLAAAWIDYLTPAEISAEIQRSLDFLQANWRDVPGRHQSVRAAFEPSWQALDTAQRELFAQLSVFRGGFTRDAAETVAGATLLDLANLVNKSLLRRDSYSGRYEMHELLRQFAHERLQAIPETEEAVAKAHAVFYSDLIQKQWLRLISKEQKSALTTIDADLGNLRRSWRYWLNDGDAQHIQMYLDCFWRIYDLRGWFQPGMELFAEAAAALKQASVTGGEETQVVYAEALAHQAFFMVQIGYVDVGFLLAQESVDILRELNRSFELALPMMTLRYNLTYIDGPQGASHGDYGDADFAADLPGQWRRAYVMTWRGMRLAWEGGDPELGLQLIMESQSLFEAIGDRLSTTWTSAALGNVAIQARRYDEAWTHYQRAQALGKEFNYGWASVKTYRYLGNIATLRGNYDEAKEYLVISLRMADELGMIRDVVSALYDIATVAAASGGREKAVHFLTVVQQHPLSNQTRSFSIWLKEPAVRFRDLAQIRLEQLQQEMGPDVYQAAQASGRALGLETAVLELLEQ